MEDVLVDGHVDGVWPGHGHLDLLLDLDGVWLLDLIGHWLLHVVGHALLDDLGHNLERNKQFSY